VIDRLHFDILVPAEGSADPQACLFPIGSADHQYVASGVRGELDARLIERHVIVGIEFAP